MLDIKMILQKAASDAGSFVVVDIAASVVTIVDASVDAAFVVPTVVSKRKSVTRYNIIELRSQKYFLY